MINDDKINNIEDNINSIINFITIIKKNILLIFYIQFVFFVVGLILLYFTPNTYKSTAMFIPPPTDMILDYTDDISSLSISSTPVNLGKNFTSFFKNPTQVYVEILKGRYIKNFIIKKYDLQNKFKDKYIEDTLIRMDKIIVVKENSGIVEISAETKDPKLSLDIVNSSISKLSELLNKLTEKSTTKFLEKRLNEIHNNLTKSSTNLKDFQIKNKLIDVQKQSEGIIESLSTLKTQIIIAESELNSLKEIYSDNSVKIKSANAKIDSLRKQLNKIQQSKGTLNLNKYPTDVALLDIPKMGLNYTSIYRDNVILEQVYILLTKQYELAKIKEARDNFELKIIDYPTIATKKSGPKKTLIMLFIILLGILTSLIIIVHKYILYNFYSKFPEKYSQLKEILGFKEK